MTLGYERDEEKYRRPRRSKAGSFNPSGGRVSTPRTSRVPQAIVKVAGWAKAPSAVRRMLDYIGRTDKEQEKEVDLKTEDGVKRRGKAQVERIAEEWKADFKRKSRHARKDERLAVHIVLSAKAELKRENLEKTQRAAQRTTEQYFGEKGYKYALGVHRDGKQPHVHVVVSAISSERGIGKLRLSPGKLFEIRKTFAEELTREGLEHKASRDKSRKRVRPSNAIGEKPNTLMKVEAVLKKLGKEQRQFERALTREVPKVNAIKHRRQQSQALETLRSQVKDDSILSDKERLKAFNLLRGFRRGIEKKGINEEIEVKATLNYVDHQMKRLEKKDPMAMKRKQAILNEMELLQRKELKKSDISLESKKRIFSHVRKHVLAINKQRGHGFERGR